MGLLEQHFDVAFAAPDGIKKLRELILTLAMQGKLVPQDPNDEPASELLRSIELEKERLVKDKKIKQQKPLPDIKAGEIPYSLPKSWKWCYLDDLCTLITDGTHYTPTYTEAGIPFISVKNLSSGKLDFSNTRFISEQEHNEFAKRCHPEEGDVLLTKVGTTGIAVTINIKKEFSIFVSVALLKLVQGFIDADYLTRLINSPLVKKYSADGTEGVGNKNLVLRKIKAFIIPLPPLAEQRRIVAKIDQLMARCDELEKLRVDRSQRLLTVHTAALDRLLTAKDSSEFSTAWSFITQHFGELYSVKENVVELRKTILQIAVMGKLVRQDPNDEPASELLRSIELEKQRLVKEGKIKQPKPLLKINPEEIPYFLPNGWEWVRVIDVVDVGTGSTPATTNLTYYNGTIPWYTSSATNNIIAKTPETFITESAIKETNCKIFPSGSLIIAMYGQGKTRGQISEIVLPGATNQAIAAMVFYESSKEIKRYIKYYFVKIYEEIRSIAEGGAQPNLNVGKIKETLIPLPPLAEQGRIVEKIDRLMGMCDRLEESIDLVKVNRQIC
jgi:type I restriction enzyme, S subunit